MTTPTIDPAFIDFDNAIYVLMNQDYTTDSFNLGQRTYQSDHIYRVDRHIMAEILANSAGQVFTQSDFARDPETGRLIRPIAFLVSRPNVAIMSKVSRWFSANGRDTHYFSVGKVAKVPSNLAAWMIQAGHAEAA
jgi:hypothetical protein